MGRYQYGETMNSVLKRVVIYAIVLLICSVYCVLYFKPIGAIASANAIGIANVAVLALLTWLLVRPVLFMVWGSYLVLTAIYYGAVHPAFPYVKDIVVYTFALISILVMFYDVFIDNCKGILRRTYLRLNSE